MTRHRVKRCLRTDKAIDLGELLRSVILAGGFVQTHRQDGSSFTGYRDALAMGLLLTGPIPETSTGINLRCLPG